VIADSGQAVSSSGPVTLPPLPIGTEPRPDPSEASGPNVVVIGAGPAGLTAAFQLVRNDLADGTLVLEADDVVGGISRTVERDGWRFDIGGHRFFTKVPEVEKLWHDILPDGDFLLRPRMSRIYYGGKFYDYPLRASNALSNLGVMEAFKCVASYAWARVRKPKDQTSLEGWVASRFGWRLYRIFFKTYTEKVWGVPAASIQADWAAQRIKNLSLGKAIVNALMPKRNSKDVTSLIEEFQYPKYGPGMMWEVCRDKVEAGGVQIRMRSRVQRVQHQGGLARTVHFDDERGRTHQRPCDAVVSSMPLGALVRAMDPPPPADVLEAADSLRYRDFLTVALVVPDAQSFPDNWIYVHSPDVKVGRIQNFGSWSPYMVKPGFTCLGLEYFTNIGDEIWSMSDEDLIALGTRELSLLGLVREGSVQSGYVVRMPKAYPVYDASYAENVEILRNWIEANAANVHPVGRNGMHRYNNQDHSMLTAVLAVENILFDAGHDLWTVNVEQEYHEEVSSDSVSNSDSVVDVATGLEPAAGTGRAAPVTG
jgi:protoporphyrinogen oxidase